MPTAKDGSKHASHSRAKFHDDREEEKKKSAKPKSDMDGEPGGKESPEPKAKGRDEMEDDARGGAEGGPEGEHEPSPEMIDDVVAEHGPADKMEAHMKDGMTHMTTHHGGFQHKSTHADPTMAAHHMMKAMGHQPPPNAPAPAPAAMGGGADMGGGYGGGGGIPGMM